MAVRRRHRSLALMLAAALGCVASVPCPRTSEAALPSARAHGVSSAGPGHHAHPAPADTAPAPAPHAHAHHASHAHPAAHAVPERAAEPTAIPALSAPCTCGCQDDAAPSAAGARLGEALRRAPIEPLARPAWDTATALHPALPEAPCDARDPVPI